MEKRCLPGVYFSTDDKLESGRDILRTDRAETPDQPLMDARASNVVLSLWA